MTPPPVIVPLDFETSVLRDALAARAHDADRDMAGSMASTVQWWAALIHDHHTRIAPVDFAGLLNLNHSRFFAAICAIRRRWTHECFARARD